MYTATDCPFRDNARLHRFLTVARGIRADSYFDVRFTNSSSDQSRSVTFAAMAGVTRKVL
jgi:hypothetical protein